MNLSEAERSSEAMEAFLAAQTKFLEQQQRFALEEEARKTAIHLAQLKELEDRGNFLKLQEEQSEEAKTQREASELKKQRMKQADRLEKWHDGNQADAYLTKFETVMTECDIPKEQWRGRLVNCLTGRALTAYRSVMEGGEPMDYDNLKDKLLEAMGLGLNKPDENSGTLASECLIPLWTCYDSSTLVIHALREIVQPQHNYDKRLSSDDSCPFTQPTSLIMCTFGSRSAPTKLPNICTTTSTATRGRKGAWTTPVRLR